MTNKDNKRPISPHLQIYAWNISSLTSIAHRLSGVVLYLSIVLISWYVVLFAYDVNPAPMGEVKEACDCLFKTILGYAACFAFVAVILALCYHFCNGIRHLFWDIGKGFELCVARKTGYLVIILSLVLAGSIIFSIAYFKFM